LDNILLVGSNGYLANYFIEAYSNNKDYKIYGVSRSNKQETDVFIQSDISKDLPILPNVFYKTVIHNAGKAHMVPKTEAEKQLFYQTNTIGTKHVLDAISKLNTLPELFVFISSVAVYGKITGTMIDETTEPIPNTPYGISKYKAEKIVTEWGEKHKVPYLILRLPLIVGVNAPGNLGAISKAIKKNRYIRIRDNYAKKSVVLAKDIAQMIESLNTVSSGIYNLTDGKHPSFFEIEEAFRTRYNGKILITLPKILIKALGKVGDLIEKIIKKETVNSDKIQKMISDLTFDDQKARQELGWVSSNVIDFIKHNYHSS